MELQHPHLCPTLEETINKSPAPLIPQRLSCLQGAVKNDPSIVDKALVSFAFSEHLKTLPYGVFAYHNVKRHNRHQLWFPFAQRGQDRL